eukprot:757196-Alexandrium_andersonii.AAC.1
MPGGGALPATAAGGGCDGSAFAGGSGAGGPPRMRGGGTLTGGALPAPLGSPVRCPASDPGPALGVAVCADARSPEEPARLSTSPEALGSVDPERSSRREPPVALA